MTSAGLHTLKLEAPAKLNPFLRVLGRRDDGYHELETLVVPLTLADRVRVHAHADPAMFRTLSLALEVEGEPDLTRGVPVDETNLALRAADALAQEVRPFGFADIVLEKRIPHGGGLGGGSADAAAVLHALNDLWGGGLPPDRLRDIGAAVGSDVPAMLAGRPVIAGGRGERVTPVRAASFGWLLVTFGFRVSTAEAFGWWDGDAAATGPDPAPVLDAVASGDPALLGGLLFNDLEASVLGRHPEIAAARDAMLMAGLAGAVLCGSGASIAGLLPAGAEPASLSALAESLAGATGRDPMFVRSIGGDER